MNLLLAPPIATPHPEWCALHDDEVNVCLGNAVNLDFTADCGPGRIDWASASLGYCPEEGADISLSFPGLGSAYMSVDNAEKLALAVLALVATARRSNDIDTGIHMAVAELAARGTGGAR